MAMAFGIYELAGHDSGLIVPNPTDNCQGKLPKFRSHCCYCTRDLAETALLLRRLGVDADLLQHLRLFIQFRFSLGKAIGR